MVVTISQNKIGEEEAVGPSHLMVFAGHVAGGCSGAVGGGSRGEL